VDHLWSDDLYGADGGEDEPAPGSGDDGILPYFWCALDCILISHFHQVWLRYLRDISKKHSNFSDLLQTSPTFTPKTLLYRSHFWPKGRLTL